MEMREGFCPKCGNALQIPAHLEEFSCLFCGARLGHGALLTQAEASLEASPEDYAIFEAEALHAAVDYPQSLENMSKPLFFDYFEQYYEKNSRPFEALSRWVIASGGAGAEAAARQLMEQVERWFTEQKGWGFRPHRTELRDRTKFTITIFLIPTVFKCAPAIAEKFCGTLREEWLRLHPDSPFELVTYETIAEGFRKRALCFITTAVCEYRGLPDDCALLCELRTFRDGYLSADAGGRALIREYYDTAPGVVLRIDCCENREKVYGALYRDYLLPCQRALRANEPEKCRELYIRMMRDLQANKLYS